MDSTNPFKWRHFQAEIIFLCVRWSLRYALISRDVEEMMLERGLHVEHTTIYRWVQCYTPALEQLSSRRDTGVAKRFFSKALAAPHSSTPGVITVDKHAAYLKAFNSLKAEGIMPDPCALRQSKYLNTLIEQDHRFIKRLVKTGMGFFSFEIAWRT